MNRRKAIFAACFLVLALLFGALRSRAQEEPQQPVPDAPQQSTPDTPQEPFPQAPPKPAGTAFPGFNIGDREGELQPDFSPLTGMQNTTLGIPEIRHSYWVPGLQFSSNLQSNPYTSSGGSGWYADNYFIGNVGLVEAFSRGVMILNYSGGGFLSTNSQQGSGYYQQLGFAQNFHTARWLIQMVDRFSYTPESTFGFGGGTNLGLPGVGGSFGTTIPGIGGNYTANQSIFGVGPFYTNTAALQATYAVSRRGSITLAGSYGILSFTQPGNLDTDTTVGSIGYNYALTRSDTLGLVYRFSAYHYPGNPQAYGDHVVSVAYGRKVTGHLALRLFVGPEFTNYRVPIGTTSRTTGFSATANVTYGFKRSSLGFSYIHGLSGGSGVLIGSVLDQATVTYSRNLTRAWTGGVNFGYARNTNVGGTVPTGNPVYDDWFIGGNLSRPIGRNFNLSVAYTASVGQYSQSMCTGCNTSSTYNTVTVNFQWHARPFVLR
jgi:hypothetical protein